MNTRLIRFEKDDVLFRAGDTSRNMYIIRSGKVKVFIEKEEETIPITELGQGQYVGEMSFLTGVKRSATVVATCTTIVNELPYTILEDEHLGISSWAVAIAKVLVRRIRTTTEQLSEYMLGHEINDESGIDPSFPENLTRDASSRDNLTKRLYLKGRFTEKSIEPIKRKIREIKIKKGAVLVLDFSDVIDIEQAGINYIFNLVKSNEVAEKKIQIENIQLIRDKVLSIKGLQNIVTKTRIPIKHVEKDELLIRQGALEHVMYVVKNGSFTISTETEKGTVILAKAESGDVIGEMSLIKEGIRSADVRADKSSTVQVLDVRDFYNNVYNVPGWFLELIRGLVQRLRDTNEMIIRYERGDDIAKPEGEWSKPFGIIIDTSRPGKFGLSGAVNLPNLQYFLHILKLERLKKTKTILIDMRKVTSLDDEANTALTDFSNNLRAQGITVRIKDPEKLI